MKRNMPPPQKDGFDIIIDFFFGALFVDFWVLIGFARSARRLDFQWNSPVFWICLFAASAIGGSLAALYRNQFWSNYETYSVIPPMEESVSKRSKVILWIVFALGCAALGLLFIS